MSDELRSVAAELGCRPGDLNFLSPLDEDDLGRLAADVNAARRAHHEHIVGSLEEALGHVPRVLRGPMRRVFGV